MQRKALDGASPAVKIWTIADQNQTFLLRVKLSVTR